MKDHKYKLNIKEQKVWDNAPDCECDIKNCKTRHKICTICDFAMDINDFYKPSKDKDYNEKSWGIHYIVPEKLISKLAYWANLRGIVRLDDQKNLQAIHTMCNDIKGETFDNRFMNGYNR